MGILYHLNAGEYVEQYDFPKDPEVAKRFAQRGVIHSWAQPDGTQKIEDKGLFGTERQRTHRAGDSQGVETLYHRYGEGRQTVFCLAQHHADALPHEPTARNTMARAATASTPTA